MERDFMGLKTAKVKTEVPEETRDSARLRGSTMQWSFSNNASANSQFFSFEGAGTGAKDDKPKTGFQALASTGLVTITTTEAVDSSQKPYSSVMQKNMVLDKQGGTHYTVSTYPSKPFDALSVHRPHEARGIPLATQTKQTVSVTMTVPVRQSFTSPAGQNLIGSTTPQSLPAPSSIPFVNSASPLVGTTELRSTSKTSGAPAQLTIFYAGSVCVYDDISPEKAQAIMLLAGNAPPVASPAVPTVAAVPAVPAVPISPVQAPMVRPSIVESLAVNQSNNAKPCISSPIPITCHTLGRSVTPNDVTAMRTIGTLAAPNKGEPSRNTSSLASAPAPLVASTAVPQFRKASLARFLEKRKERTLSASPYATNKPSEECGSPASGGRSISVNSSGSCPLPAIN